MKTRRIACLLVTLLLSHSAFAAKPQDPVTPFAQVHADVTSGVAPLTVSFSARGSFDPDNGLLVYSWDFGDGSTGTGLDIAHQYVAPGFYVAVLRVTDPTGLFDVASIEIRVRVDTQPAVNITATPSSGTAPLVVQFASAVGGGDPPFTYSWDFGDGGSSPLANPSHIYSAPGIFNAVLTVTDQDGDTAVDAVAISVQLP